MSNIVANLFSTTETLRSHLMWGKALPSDFHLQEQQSVSPTKAFSGEDFSQAFFRQGVFFYRYGSEHGEEPFEVAVHSAPG